MPIRVVFLGPPGTGKGTQARRMSERFGLAALSSGDVLRQEIAEQSHVGRQAQSYVQEGTLVPDSVVTAVMLAGIDKLRSGTGFILDGFPRTVPQAEALAEGLRQRGWRLQAAIDFQMDDRLLIERLVTRRVCSRCGRTYNIRFLPPKAEGRCDGCGGALVQRVDDREDVVATRLATYRQQTAPLIEYYLHRGVYQTVDASAPAERVEAAIVGILMGLSDTE